MHLAIHEALRQNPAGICTRSHKRSIERAGRVSKHLDGEPNGVRIA